MASVTKLNSLPPSYAFESLSIIMVYVMIYLAKIYIRIMAILKYREIGLFEEGDIY
jgi:hypothetical protein